MRSPLSRRSFLGRVAGMAAAPYVIPSTVFVAGNAAPSERIRVGFIGLGNRGNGHLGAFLGRADVQVLAVCDAYRSKGDAAKAKVDAAYNNQDCAVFQDFRELIARDDIDAVVIASPENWHGLQGAMAAAAGKDVYGEKALTLTVQEGRSLIRTVRRHACIYQVGTQQRSSRDFRLACELVRNGYIGTLHTVRVSVPGGRALPDAPTTPPPPDLDYEMWLGPAPFTPHNDVKGSFNWYFIRDYCAGWIQSWGVHHVDIALWGAPKLAQERIQVSGTATFPPTGLADTSVTWKVECVIEEGLRLVFTDESYERHGCLFEGTEGWIHVDRSGIRTSPESLTRLTLKPTDERLYVSNDHVDNFLECIRTRRDPAAPVEAAHAATTLALVADIATRLKRPLAWDWELERFLNDPEADRFLVRSMRSPWRMPDA